MEQVLTHAALKITLPFVAVVQRVQNWLKNLSEAQAQATEFAALNALSDADLARLGLTRAVLKRHLRQKYRYQAMLRPEAGWHEPADPRHQDR